MIRLPPRSTRTDTLFPYTTLFRSGAYVGAAETVDGLFRVAHQEQYPGANPERRPVFSRITVGRFAAEAPEYLHLEGIGVLKLVDQDMGIAAGERAPEIGRAHV